MTCRYAVEFRRPDDIKPSPENDDLYGSVRRDDEQFDALVDSIKTHGLEEPLIVTLDDFILSGHRRYAACEVADIDEIPVRVKDVRREGHPEYKKLLTEYNPQRVKTAGSLLKEALLRAEDMNDLVFDDFRASSLDVDVEFLSVEGVKKYKPIGANRQEFLEAVQRVVNEELRKYWPLSIRQIHYNLLNNPPRTQTPKKSKHGPEHWRYRNNKDCYDRLVDLLTPARYHKQISMQAIDDPTRPQKTWPGYRNASQFIHAEVDNFLWGFHLDKQIGQPRHIEVFGEKNTLMQVVQRATEDYYVPYSLGRGYCSIPVWRDIAQRFRKSGKDRMTLIVLSDYDPEGLDLADDAERSLRDCWGVPIDTHRIALTREQINEFDLANDFNPAKVKSSRYDSFVDRTGSDESWELEAVNPGSLIELTKAAIEANMDMDVFEAVREQEQESADEIEDFRQQIIDQLDI